MSLPQAINSNIYSPHLLKHISVIDKRIILKLSLAQPSQTESPSEDLCAWSELSTFVVKPLREHHSRLPTAESSDGQDSERWHVAFMLQTCSASAFNTIQPALLGDKLELAGVNQHLTSWIPDFLTNRPQYVRIQDNVSDTVVCSMGAPQGTVMATFLSLGTGMGTYSGLCGLVPVEPPTAQRWEDQRAGGGFLQAQTTQENIEGTDIEMVTSYKYLGVHMNNKLDWTDHTAAIYKQGQSRLHLLRKLRSF